MPPTQPSLILNLFLIPTGHHEAAWRHPTTVVDGIYTLEYYVDLARRAENAHLDAIFLADSPALWSGAEFTASGRLEPLTTIAAIAARTEKIGLIATASTTFSDVYTLARTFNTIDHLSGGRVGWNIVTSLSEDAARNYGRETLPDPAERYARADEFVRAARALWDSWEDDAIVADVASGHYLDAGRIHPAQFRGQYLSTLGALTAPRSPQGHPVLVQAGSSGIGRDFAGRHAEAIFTAHQRLEDAVEFADDMRARVTAAGRDPRALRILPGISPIVGATRADAEELAAEYSRLQVDEYGLKIARDYTGADLDESDLDRRITVDMLEAGGLLAGFRSRLSLLAGVIEREQPTLRELLRRVATARGHFVVAGTAEDVADAIATWQQAGAADGFNVMPPTLPDGLDSFVDSVVPILQERGLFRTEYTGATLRDRYRLARPPVLLPSSTVTVATY